MEKANVEDLLKSIENLSATDKIAMLALIVSVASVIFSIYSIRLQKKLNMQNLQAVYYEKIFNKYLLSEIPTVVTELDFNEKGKLNSYKMEINKTMMRMVRDARYFRYANRTFYFELTKHTQELEDALADLANKVVTDREEKNRELLAIHLLVSEVIACINKYYCK